MFTGKKVKNKLKEIIKTYREFIGGIRKFFIFLKPYRKYGYIAAFFLGISVLLELPMPFFTMYLIDKVIPGKKLYLLNLMAILLLFLLIVRAFSLFFYRLNIVKYKTRVIFDIRKKLIEKVLNIPYLKFKDLSPGYMVTRIDGDVDQLEGLMAETFIDILKDIITFLVGIGILFFLNVKMAISALLLLPLFVWTMHHFGVKLNKLTEVLRERWAEFTKEIEELIESGLSLKARVRESFGIFKFCKRHIRALKQDVKTEITGALSGIVLDVVGSLSPLVILWLGIREIINGGLTLGEFFAFNSFLMYLYGPISSLVNTNVDIHSTLASADRIFEILNWEEEPSGNIELNSLKGEVVFKGVSFSYSLDKEFYFDFKILPGEKIAIVGESGSGKSTILKLMVGFLRDYGGEIFIDGIKLEEIDLKSLRKLIGYGSGENFIFSGTISENISLYTICDEKWLNRCMEMADCFEFVERLEKGINTKIGREGRKLSTGEMQRINLARVLYGRPEMLILDEITSGVDLKSEKKIYNALLREFSDKTVIVVNHRVESVKGFDRILFVKDGEVVEEGDFLSLMKKRGDFYRLYTYQKRNLERISEKN